jgi:hypothetical protein
VAIKVSFRGSGKGGGHKIIKLSMAGKGRGYISNF